MILLIPLGGTGQRFSQNGYKKPKALINVMGKPILFWLLDNLNIPQNEDTIIYIPYNRVYKPYRLEDMLLKEYPKVNFKFLCLNNDTRGAAETIYISLGALERAYLDEPVLCIDGDNFYTCDIIKAWNKENMLITFNDHQEKPIYSYVECNTESDVIKNIVEKEKISNDACCGVYGFSSKKALLTYCKHIIDNNILQKNEFYTSTVIKEMINAGSQFKKKNINTNNYVCLGTPTQVRLFCHNYPRYSSINGELMVKPKRYCFDLDNTLVTFPRVPNDYKTVEPIHKNIELLKYLKRFGHTIIIYTARRMRTHKGNVGKILQDIGKTTFETLEQFDIPYDEIYFGKPEANYYIDDLALSCFDDMEKELGYYETMIKPRDFNTIHSDTIMVCTKRSNDLSGEIHYYRNIPYSVKDMFPIMVDYDTNNQWYSVEKINGITASNLYLSQLLTEEQLKHIMNSIYRLQTCDNRKNQYSANRDNINVLYNYIPKLKERYEKYNYSIYPNHSETFQEICKSLENYKGKKTVIHGDPVFTNVIINNFGKIKFIDMRGRQGSKLTIYGDYLYDWAKMYQSIIGYDEIHEDKLLDISYKEKIKKCFKETFNEFYGEDNFNMLLNVCKSLLFSLIPLHNNEKCIKYYELIKHCN